MCCVDGTPLFSVVITFNSNKSHDVTNWYAAKKYFTSKLGELEMLNRKVPFFTTF